MKLPLPLLLFCLVASALHGAHPLLGDWSLTLPSQEAGWLSVREANGAVTAELLWAVGSARQIEGLKVEREALVFERSIRRPLAPKGEPATRYQITLTAEKDRLTGRMQPLPTGETRFIVGKKQPARAL